MKNLMTVLASLLMVGAVICGCGPAAPAAIAPTEPKVGPPIVSPASPVAFDRAKADELLIDQVRDETEKSISELLMSNQPVPEAQYTTLRNAEEARQSLRRLEEERLAFQAVIDETIMCGQPVPDYLQAAIRSLEHGRHAVLSGIGIAN